MNENLIEIIKQYLKIETNYAVIINGGYGIGKTYFFKKLLSPEIKKISIFRDDRKKYIPIHISLFGINSIEEVQTQIFFAIYPILKKKGIKLAAGIGKSIIRGVAQLKGFGNIDDYIADIDVSADEWLNYDELVLCFDDLDRKSNSLEIKDILGFINTLVENHGAKIIIIANEEKLHVDETYNTELREKVVGVSIEFTQDIDNVYDLIIHERYFAGYKVYHKFLLEHKEIIIDVIKKNNNNLRNLIFFLEHFKVIYYPLIKLFEDDKNFKVVRKEKLNTVLEFSLSIGIEYKTGKLNSSNFSEIENLKRFAFHDSLFEETTNNSSAEESKKIKKSYSSIFKEKYYEKKHYKFLPSIFKYITGQSAFEIENLKSELEKIYVVEQGAIPEYQKILNKLGYFNCVELTNKEYRETTNKMLEFVDDSKFPLNDYPTVFHFATRFNNILNLNIEKLKKRLKKGIDKGIDKYKYDNHIHFRLTLEEDVEFKEDLSEIMKYCFSSNNKIKTISENKNNIDSIDILENDFNKFIEISKDRDNEIRYKPFWTTISVNKAYQIINKLTNIDITELAFYFKERYRIQIYDGLHPEKEFLVKLKEKIDFPKRRKNKNLRNASLDFLIKHINQCISNFPS